MNICVKNEIKTRKRIKKNIKNTVGGFSVYNLEGFSDLWVQLGEPNAALISLQRKKRREKEGWSQRTTSLCLHQPNGNTVYKNRVSLNLTGGLHPSLSLYRRPPTPPSRASFSRKGIWKCAEMVNLRICRELGKEQHILF